MIDVSARLQPLMGGQHSICMLTIFKIIWCLRVNIVRYIDAANTAVSVTCIAVQVRLPKGFKGLQASAYFLSGISRIKRSWNPIGQIFAEKDAQL